VDLKMNLLSILTMQDSGAPSLSRMVEFLFG
jgi:hypothetical protein